MYKILINIHIFSSTLFALSAIFESFITVKGLIYKEKYTKIHRISEICFITLIYIGLVEGIIMYFFLDPANKPKVLTLTQALDNSAIRFWAIEHFCVMLFALLMAQIGFIFTTRSNSDHAKLKYASFYYGIATLVTFISTVFYLISKTINRF